MIYYKFSKANEKVVELAVPLIFRGYFSETWLESSDILSMVEEVEQSEYLGGVLLHKADGTTYSIYDICHGLQILLCGIYVPKQHFKFESIGTNLYPYLLQIFGKDNHDIHLVGRLNPFTLAKMFEIEFPRIQLEDLNLIVSTEEEFKQAYLHWVDSQDLKIPNIVQQLNWNRKLSNPFSFKLVPNSPTEVVIFPKFEMNIKYKLTFIQGLSAAGKTYFFNIVNSYQRFISFNGSPVPFYLITSKTQLDPLLSIQSDAIILIDLDVHEYDLTYFSFILDTPDNFKFMLVGHWFQQQIAVPLDSIWDVNYDRRLNEFNFTQNFLPKNWGLSKYHYILTEDGGSGCRLMKTIYPYAKVESSNGFANLTSSAKKSIYRYNSSLVCMDYATSYANLVRMVPKQDTAKFDILVITSTEFILLYLLGLEQEYWSYLKMIQEWDSATIRWRLRKLRKTVITSETLDLLIFSMILKDKFGLSLDPDSYKSESILASLPSQLTDAHMMINKLVLEYPRFEDGEAVDPIDAMPYAEKDHNFG